MAASNTASPASGSVSKDRSMFWCHVGAVLTMVAWGISFVSSKVLLDNGLNAVEIYVYRFGLAYLLLLCMCHKKLMSNNWRDEMLFLVCGLCGGSIYFIAENIALKYTLVSNVSLITTTSPLLTTLLLGALYKSERPSAGVLGGSLVAFLGVGCVIFNSSFVIKMNPFGDLLALGAAFTFAIYAVVLRRLNAFYSATFITRKTFFYGVITALPFLPMDPEHASLDVLLRPAVWGNIVFLSAFASVFAFMIWSIAIKKMGTVKASNYLYFQPVVTLVASALILSEKVTIVGYTGCALILIGVWLSDWLGRKSAMKATA